MPERLTCSNRDCGQPIDVPQSVEGTTLYCPHCGTRQPIPEGAGAPSHANAQAVGPTLRRASLTPEERERILQASAQDEARSRLVRKAVVLVVVVGIAWLAYRHVSRRMAEHRVRGLLLEAARGKNAKGAAQKLAARLPLVISHCNELLDESEGSSDLATIVTGLRIALGRLPADADLTPVLELTPDAGGAYRAAVALVRKRAGRDWLIASTCKGSDAARAFAIEVLRPSFPLGRLTDEDAAKLARRTNVSDKEKLFDEVHDTVHRRLEAELTGRYRIRVVAAWKSPGRKAAPHEMTTAVPPIHVSCENRTWRVKMGDSKWAGTVGKLPTLKLTCRPQILFGLKMATAPFRSLWSSKATLEFREKLAVSVHPVPRYAPASRGWTPLDRRSRVPRGARIIGTEIRARGGFPAPGVVWTLPAQAGFEKLGIILAKAQ